MSANSYSDWKRTIESESLVLKSLEAENLALENEIKARDLVFVPLISAEVSDSKDRQPSLTQATRESNSTQGKLGLSQYFSTGTLVQAELGQNFNDSLTFGNRYFTTWLLTARQSLWRDFFGRNNRWRWNLDRAELKSRKYQILNKKIQFFVNAETLYWTGLGLGVEIELRRKALEAGRRLESWTLSRTLKASAERIDLLQVQAQNSLRNLDLQQTELKIADLRQQFLNLWPSASLVLFDDTLRKSFEELKKTENILLEAPDSLDSRVHLSVLEKKEALKVLRMQDEMNKDKLRPDLTLFGSYGQVGMNEARSVSERLAFNSEARATTIGVNFSWQIEGDAVESSRKSTLHRVRSLELELEVLQQQKKSEAEFLGLRLNNLRQQLRELQKLVLFQKEKSQEELKRYQLGRSTVFQLVTFEQAALDAELSFYQSLVTYKKIWLQRDFYLSEEI